MSLEMYSTPFAKRVRSRPPSDRGERRYNWLSKIGDSIRKTTIDPLKHVVTGNLKGAVNDIHSGTIDAAHGTGEVASNPYVQGTAAAILGATGVGAPLAAAILAGGSALGNATKEHGTLGSALKGAATGAITGYGGAQLGAGLGSALSSGGASGLAKAGGEIALKKAISGGGADLGGAGGTTPATQSSGGGFDLGSLISGLGGASGIGNTALGGAQLLNAANLQKQSTGYATGALDTANKSYDERAPLRTAGVAGLLNPGAGVDLSGLKKIAGRNSFA